jgi:hypothetical protein
MNREGGNLSPENSGSRISRVGDFLYGALTEPTSWEP